MNSQSHSGENVLKTGRMNRKVLVLQKDDTGTAQNTSYSLQSQG